MDSSPFLEPLPPPPPPPPNNNNNNSTSMKKRKEPTGYWSSSSSQKINTGVKKRAVLLENNNIRDNEIVLNILANMPKDCDPIEYLKRRKRELYLNTLEDATMRKLMSNQLTFFTYRLKLEKSLDVKFPLKKYGQKYSSAPSSPLKLKEAGTNNNNPPSRTGTGEGEVMMVTTSLASSGVQVLPKLECLYVHLLAALEFEKSNEMIKKGIRGSWGRSGGLQEKDEPLRLVRTLNKKGVELLQLLTMDLDDKYWRIVGEAGVVAGMIYDAYCRTKHPLMKNKWTMSDTGIQYLVEKIVLWLMDEGNRDALMALRRKTLVMEIVYCTKSLKVRHFFLEQFVNALHLLVRRLQEAKNSSSTVFNFPDISAAFNFFQLIEYILVTSGKEHWIEETLWWRITKIEEEVMKNLKLPNVMIMICRQVNLAKPLVNFPASYDPNSTVFDM